MTSGIVEWRIESLGLRKRHRSLASLGGGLVGIWMDWDSHFTFVGGFRPLHGLPAGAQCKPGSSIKCIMICVFVLLIVMVFSLRLSAPTTNYSSLDLMTHGFRHDYCQCVPLNTSCG